MVVYTEDGGVGVSWISAEIGGIASMVTWNGGQRGKKQGKYGGSRLGFYKDIGKERRGMMLPDHAIRNAKRRVIKGTIGTFQPR